MTSPAQTPSNDTRRRLILTLSAGYIDGYLLPRDGSAKGAERVYAQFAGGRDASLRGIEAAIYENPVLLDDNPAEILIDTTDLLFYPSGMDDEALDGVMRRLYDVAPEDFFKETLGDDIRCAFTLCRGLRGFVERTFPGIAVTSALSPIVRKYRKSNSGDTVYADLRPGRLDIVAYSGRRFLCGVSREVSRLEDMVYYIVMTLNTFGFDPATVNVLLSGQRDMRRELTVFLRRAVTFVRVTPLPVFPFPFPLPFSTGILYKQST